MSLQSAGILAISSLTIISVIMKGPILWTLVSFLAYSDQSGLTNRSKYSTTCPCSDRGKDVFATGRKKIPIEDRIIGGQDAFRSFPMMTGLCTTKNFCSFCGASILTKRHVLTAAHCVNNDPSNLVLSAGRMTRCAKTNDGGMLIPMVKQKPIIHSKYNKKTNHYDIAILITDSPIPFSDSVGPVCLPSEVFTSNNDKLWMLGWGRTKETGNTSKWLQVVDLDLIPLRKCLVMVTHRNFISDDSNQLCTYAHSKDGCQGDSGGPVLYFHRGLGRMVQAAIVSMGKGCGRMLEPGINTEIYPFLNWIGQSVHESTKAMQSNITFVPATTLDNTNHQFSNYLHSLFCKPDLELLERQINEHDVD